MVAIVIMTYNVTSVQCHYNFMWSPYTYIIIIIYRQQRKLLHHSTDSVPSPNQLITAPAFELVQQWRVDTGKCVDASPLLIQDDSHDPPEIIYIGSHSGRFFAICFRTGRVLWETQLTDRIESSASLSVCGQFVIVGESDNIKFMAIITYMYNVIISCSPVLGPLCMHVHVLCKLNFTIMLNLH